MQNTSFAVQPKVIVGEISLSPVRENLKKERASLRLFFVCMCVCDGALCSNVSDIKTIEGGGA